ncbi:putative transcription factor Znf-LSD family [Helianthus annuus]|nr:putative transcription factor Znf-LSD family [Helianthus annuus]
MNMLVNCSNCRTPLTLPPGAKSIRCAICQAITPIADPSSPRPPYSGRDQSYPTGYTVINGPAATHVTSPPPYSYAPAGSPPSVHGRKKAVIVGVSYRNTNHELKGCINDAKYMKHLLITKFQFPEASIVMLTEEEKDPSLIPTGRNMRNALYWLINGCQSGDSLLFHFSGHGSRQRNRNGDELDGYDETLCPLDFETDGMIIDDEINATIVRPLPYGVRLHAIIDSCHSGTVLDLPFLCRMNTTGHYEWEDHRPKSGIWKGSSGGEVISISGCDDDQTSADTSALSKITSTGAMTYCFIEAIEHGNASTYGSLLSSMRNAIRTPRGTFNGGSGSVFDALVGGGRNGSRGFSQEPQLTSCEPFDMYTKPFSL